MKSMKRRIQNPFSTKHIFAKKKHVLTKNTWETKNIFSTKNMISPKNIFLTTTKNMFAPKTYFHQKNCRQITCFHQKICFHQKKCVFTKKTFSPTKKIIKTCFHKKTQNIPKHLKTSKTVPKCTKKKTPKRLKTSQNHLKNVQRHLILSQNIKQILDKVVKLVGGGSVSNGATPSSFKLSRESFNSSITNFKFF